MKKKNECIFCKLLTGELEVSMVYQDHHCSAFMDTNHEAIKKRLVRIALAIDDRPPVENLASLVNGFLIHVVVSHRHLHVTVA
jgi:hypothetical protein